jgi:predicted phage terminase large subunit-like protein
VSAALAELADLFADALDVGVSAVPDSYGAWLASLADGFRWDYAHFRAMQARLDAVTAGTARREYSQIPIRHGKTEHNTVRYGTYRLERDPRTRLLVGSYNQRQAEKFSREIRKLTRLRGVPLSTERDAAGEWETAAGGGVRAVGAGAGVASVNADLILLDDPIGSRDEAESPAHRDRVFDWITNDILARAEPHTAVIVTMSRWHQDDPAGRLLDQQRAQWHVLDLPAEAEANDPLGRPPGAPLWPEHRGAEWLAEKKVELGSYGFASLLQGRPRPREGGMFKWVWWQLLPASPALPRLVRYWDLAGTEPKGGGHDPDFSSGTLGGRLPDGRTALVHQVAFRHSIGQRDAELERIARADVAQYGGRVAWWIETEAGIAGEDRTAQLVRRLQACGLAVHTERPTGSKVVRAEPLAAAAESLNVLLGPDDPGAPWHDAFRREAADFPNGRHDDRVDSAVGMFNKIAVRHTAATTTVRI